MTVLQMASAEWGGKKPYVKCQTSPAPELCHSCPDVVLTLPRSRMKQSPVLKLSQLTGTSVARTVLLPLTCSSLCTVTSLGTTCLKPEATPPAWGEKQEQRFTPGLGEECIPMYNMSCLPEIIQSSGFTFSADRHRELFINAGNRTHVSHPQKKHNQV